MKIINTKNFFHALDFLPFSVCFFSIMIVTTIRQIESIDELMLFFIIPMIISMFLLIFLQKRFLLLFLILCIISLFPIVYFLFFGGFLFGGENLELLELSNVFEKILHILTSATSIFFLAAVFYQKKALSSHNLYKYLLINKIRENKIYLVIPLLIFIIPIASEILTKPSSLLPAIIMFLLFTISIILGALFIDTGRKKQTHP